MLSLKDYAKIPQKAISLYQLMKHGDKLCMQDIYIGSIFMHEEIPVRLAHRIQELECLPRELVEEPLVMQVKELYHSSWTDCVKLEKLDYNIKDLKDSSVKEYIDNVYETMSRIKRRHVNIVELLARGVKSYLNAQKYTLSDKFCLHEFLNGFYTSRIGIRCLLGHHLALYDQLKTNDLDPNWIGIICKRTNILQVCKNAVQDAIMVFEAHYGPFTAPKVSFCAIGKHPELNYIPNHLHHIMFELAKNSLRATYDAHGHKDNMPEVKVIVTEGSEDVTIKLADEGGGIPRTAERLIWTYGYTTAEGFVDNDKVPLAGFGYGLPLSRLYARYFGGDLNVISMDGYGTDAYVNLRRLSDTYEPIIN